MQAKRLILILLLALAAAGQNRQLGRIRRERMPEAYAGYSAETPPALNFVMAGLGGFRGIVSEILWLRVSRLQDEGRFIELVQLAEWITMLDPRAAEAWTYNAWNLAYNVSVMMIRPEDRLRWVKNGIAILRDDGLRYNPENAKLLRELAWLYQNKIGMDLDAAHLTYKLDLARSMQPLLLPDGSLDDTPENRGRLREMRLEADTMIALQQRFGALDWRLANAHALYWASLALEHAAGSETLLCQRALYQPLMLMTLDGRFTGDLEKGVWSTAPRPSLALPAAASMKATLDEHPSRNTLNVYLRFLIRAIQLLDSHDRRADAGRLYADLKSALPPDVAAPSYAEVIEGRVPLP
jgi:hypothetical protein